MSAAPPRPVALLAVLDDSLAGLIRDAGYRVLRTTSGAEAVALAIRTPPDVVVIDPLLEDMSGTDACRLLRTDPAIARHLPVLIALDRAPTAELRVAAVRVGVWDFIVRTAGAREIAAKLASFVEAKRTMAASVDDGFLDPASGFCTRPALARRTKEMFALMTRLRAPITCLVFEIEGAVGLPDLGSVVARGTRISDIIGDIGAQRIGVLAPATEERGAVELARRINAVVDGTISERRTPGSNRQIAMVTAGYETIANAKYAPADPYEILQRAANAVHHGEPDPANAWLRRYDAVLAPGRITAAVAVNAPPTRRSHDPGGSK